MNIVISLELSIKLLKKFPVLLQAPLYSTLPRDIYFSFYWEIKWNYRFEMGQTLRSSYTKEDHSLTFSSYKFPLKPCDQAMVTCLDPRLLLPLTKSTNVLKRSFTKNSSLKVEEVTVSVLNWEFQHFYIGVSCQQDLSWELNSDTFSLEIQIR